MADGDVRRLAVSSSPKLSPDEIASRSFAKAVRGVSETEVRSFLTRVAEEVVAISEREESLRFRIAGLEEQLRSPKAPTDEELLTALGEETAKVLRAAQSAAEDIRTRSEERAAALLKETDEQANSIRGAAQESAASQVNLANESSAAQLAAAEVSAASMRSSAEAAATTTREVAQRDAAEVRERARIESEGEIEQARQTGREMLAEAKAVRERVLADLARRRELLTSQIVELRTGRDRLLDAYRVVKQTLSDATSALGQVDSKGASVLAKSAPFVDLGIEDEPEESLSQGSSSPLEPTALEASGADRVVINSSTISSAPSKVEEAQGDAPNTAGVGRGLRRRVRESLGITEDSTASVGIRTNAEISETFTESVTVVVVDDGVKEVDITETVIIRDEVIVEVVSASRETDPAPADLPEVASIFARLRADGAEPPAAGQVGDAPAKEAQTKGAEVNSEPVSVATDTAEDERSMCEAVLQPLLKEAIKRAKRALQDDQNALLERIRTQKGRINPEVILGDPVAQSDAWVALLSEPMTKAFIGAHTTLTTEPAPNVPQELVVGPVQVLVDALRLRLGAVIAENDLPDSDDSITRAVSSCFREARGPLLEVAIGDALSAAWSRGVYEAVATGTLLRWVPIEAGKCSDCDDNALEPTPRGEKFPTGQAFPPAHPGCRCLITPDARML